MSTKDGLTAAKARMGAFAKTSPELFDGFMKVSRAATRSGSFSTAQRELIATAISRSRVERCISRPCHRPAIARTTASSST